MSIRKFTNDVLACFPSDPKPTKIIVGCSSEYNDENYSIRGYSYIEVYAQNGDILAPQVSKIKELRKLLTGYDNYGLFENPHEEHSDEWYEWAPKDNLEIKLD